MFFQKELDKWQRQRMIVLRGLRRGRAVFHLRRPRVRVNAKVGVSLLCECGDDDSCVLADGKCSAWEGLIKWSGADSQLNLKNRNARVSRFSGNEISGSRAWLVQRPDDEL